jgi:hypothetical protein|tara:strand:+ start:168 stop:455 length:288 start_codon:yes stop_codon:yes gene_type:complete
MTDRQGILHEAERLICTERASVYGDAETMFQLVADYWSAHLSMDITPTDVGIMMALLKIARLKASPGRDSWVDSIGYLALAAELTPEKETLKNDL